MESLSLNVGLIKIRNRLKHAQQGVSALEFAVVFPLFFFIIYMAIAYGLIFAAQQSMNYAAETMARDSLLLGKSNTNSPSTIDWLKSISGGEGLDISTPAGADPSRPYEVQVIIRYDYLNHPIVPWLGPKLLGSVVFPNELVATATVDKQITGLIRP